MTDGFRPNPENSPAYRSPWSAAASVPKVSSPGQQTRAGAGSQPVQMTGRAGEFASLVIRGAILQFFTFGFYRFWLTTDVRRFLWSHTMVDGEGAEYTGTGRELLIGFLFALAVLTPIWLLYFIGGVEAERYKAFASVPLGLFLVLFGQFAMYRARRYRLTRTVWRGVRLWMDGSGWKFAFLSFGLLILVIVTLGLLYPWRAAILERYKIRHTHYGDIAGSFEASGWEFFKKGVWLWLLAFVPLGLLIAALAQLGSAGPNSIVAWEKAASAISLMVVAFLFLPFLWPFFQAIEWRWWANGVRIGGVRLISRLRGGQLLGLYMKLIFAALLLSIALSVVGGILYFAADQILKTILNVSLFEIGRQLMAASPYAGVAGAIIVYLVAGLAFGVLQRYFLQYRYWHVIVSSIEVENIHALDGAIAKGELAGALGEGLADGLDIGGF